MDERDGGLHPAWWTLILVVVFVAAILLTYALFMGTLRSVVPVTLTSDRSGLVMETNAKVKLRGVQVGRVAAITGGREPVSLKLEIDSDKIKYIPANVEAQIRATTVFGAKFVDLIYPNQPQPAAAGGRRGASGRATSPARSTPSSRTWSSVLDQVDPAKLNSTLSALAEGLRGQGRAAR